MIFQVWDVQIDYIFKKCYYNCIKICKERKNNNKEGSGHMNNIGYRNLLIQYIDRQEADQPILTTQITKYVAKETGLDETDVKKRLM